jgi:dolichol kinase
VLTDSETSDLTRYEIVACATFYQLTLYVSLRLAHRVFTLGELGLVCFGGTSLWMELLNITIARVSALLSPDFQSLIRCN